MINKELIEALKKLPENTEVLINLLSCDNKLDITDDIEIIKTEYNKIILSNNIK